MLFFSFPLSWVLVFLFFLNALLRWTRPFPSGLVAIFLFCFTMAGIIIFLCPCPSRPSLPSLPFLFVQEGGRMIAVVRSAIPFLAGQSTDVISYTFTSPACRSPVPVPPFDVCLYRVERLRSDPGRWRTNSASAAGPAPPFFQPSPFLLPPM